MAKSRQHKIDMDWEEEYDEETEYLIDDVLYYIEEDMPRATVVKHLEKCDYDIDATVNRIFQIREQKQKKKQKRKEDQLRKKEEALRQKEEELQRREQQIQHNQLQKTKTEPKEPLIPWPTSGTKPAEPDAISEAKRSSVNIDRKRKESKRILSNFKKDNHDKSFWNSAYPSIEYPQYRG